MRTITYSTFRKDLKSEMQRCRDDADCLLVANRDESENIVVMNANDYDSMMETIRIYENPELHEKILKGVAQIKSGKGNKRDLLDA